MGIAIVALLNTASGEDSLGARLTVECNLAFLANRRNEIPKSKLWPRCGRSRYRPVVLKVAGLTRLNIGARATVKRPPVRWARGRLTFKLPRKAGFSAVAVTGGSVKASEFAARTLRLVTTGSAKCGNCARHFSLPPTRGMIDAYVVRSLGARSTRMYV